MSNKTIEDILCSLTTGYTRKQLLEYSEEDTGLDKYEVLDELKSIDKATQAITQAMLDALPEKMKHRPGLSGIDNGWNACRGQMETAIKKIGGSDENTHSL